MNFTSEEAKALAVRLYAQQLLIVGICRSVPGLADALRAHVEAFSDRTLFEPIPAEEIVKHAMAIIDGPPPTSEGNR
jgi:hypothetical protein